MSHTAPRFPGASDARPERSAKHSKPLPFPVASTRQAFALEIDHNADDRCAQNRGAFQSIFDRYPQPVMVYDLKTFRFLWVNDAALRNYLFSRDEFAAMNFDQLAAAGNPAANAEIAEGVSSMSPEARVLRHRRKDGTTFEAEITTLDVQFEGRPARLATAVNAAGRAQAEASIRETEERYRDLFDNANDLIFTTDLRGRLTSLNKAGELVTGYTSEEAVKINIAQLLGPKSLDLARSMREKKVVDGGETTYELEIATKDGRLVTLLVRTWLIYQEGVPAGVRGIARDVTESKHMEAEMRQTQKMEALGRLAGGVAHDFNNLLGVMVGYGELLAEAIAPENPLSVYAKETLKAGQKAAVLTSQLLAFGRRQTLESKVLDLNAVISGMEQLLARLIRQDVEIKFSPTADVARVQVDPVQIEQVLLNLAVNARDAMPAGGELKIGTSVVNITELEKGHKSKVKPGRYVLLTVSDSGVGMDERTQANIFEPFFTTKARGKGTGLGLATVYGIVKQSGGAIVVKSEPGKGTAFMIYLPFVDEPLTQPDSDSTPHHAVGATETILLVDDSEAFRRLVRTFLERQGYQVLEAQTSAEASQLAAHHRGPIDLLLSDVIMPQVNGYQLSDYLRFQRPEMGVLFMSGYGGAGTSGRESFKRGNQVLAKPFCKDALLTAVRETLEKQRWQNAALVLGGFDDLVERECRN